MKTTELKNIIKEIVIPKIIKYEKRRKTIFIKINISWLVFLLLSPIVFLLSIGDLEQILVLTILFLVNIFFRWYYRNIIINLDNFYLEMKKEIINLLISYSTFADLN